MLGLENAHVDGGYGKGPVHGDDKGFRGRGMHSQRMRHLEVGQYTIYWKKGGSMLEFWKDEAIYTVNGKEEESIRSVTKHTSRSVNVLVVK